MNYYPPPNNYNNYQMNNGYPYNYQTPNPVFMKANEKRRISTLGKSFAVAVILFAVLSTVFGLLLSRNTTLLNEYTNNSAVANSMNTVITILMLGGPFAAVYFYLKKRGFAGGIPLGSPYDKKDFLLLLPLGLAVCILGSFATGLFATFVDAIFGVEFSQPDDGSSYTSPMGIGMSLLQTAFVPAFIEEFAIRGVVLQSLRRYGDAFAVVASSAVFALMHGNMIQIPFAFIAGLAIGYAVIKTGTMWTGIIIHFLNNSMAILSLSLVDNFSEMQATIIMTAFYAVVFVLAIICAVIYFGKNRNMFSCFSKGEITYFKNSEKASALIFNIPAIVAIIVYAVETAMYIG